MSVPKFTHTTECDDGSLCVYWNGIMRGKVYKKSNCTTYYWYMDGTNKFGIRMKFNFQNQDEAIKSLLEVWGIH